MLVTIIDKILKIAQKYISFVGYTRTFVIIFNNMYL